MLDKSNSLIASFSEADAAMLKPHLKPVNLEHQKVLFEAGGNVDAVYFPTGAVVSLVVGLSSGEMVEAAMIGRDGVVGALAALEEKMSFNLAIVQLAGPAMMCKIGPLRTAALQSPSLLSLLIRHELTVYAQASQSAACIAAHHVEARLCRWLLRARDLAGSDTLQFTHAFLSQMLGVERTSVTLVARTLQRAGMIQYTRGKIQVTDVEGLVETACECYQTVKSHHKALLGKSL